MGVSLFLNGVEIAGLNTATLYTKYPRKLKKKMKKQIILLFL